MYIADVGLINPLGHDWQAVSRLVAADVNSFSQVDMVCVKGKPIQASLFPTRLMRDLAIEPMGRDVVIDDDDYYEEYQAGEGETYRSLHEQNAIQGALYCIRKLRSGLTKSVPILIGLPETQAHSFARQGRYDKPILDTFRRKLTALVPDIEAEYVTTIPAGRTAWHHTLHRAQAFFEQGFEFVIAGGTDSLLTSARLVQLNQHHRARSSATHNALTPGEGSCFMLLTNNIAQALTQHQRVIRLHAPGFASETVDWYDHHQQPSRYEALDQAFKQALSTLEPEQRISRIYSTMNGESFWAKEFGVATIRNQSAFAEQWQHEHTADSLGDTGAASAATQAALAAFDLLNGVPDQANQTAHHLVYASADTQDRAAVVLSADLIHDQQ